MEDQVQEAAGLFTAGLLPIRAGCVQQLVTAVAIEHITDYLESRVRTLVRQILEDVGPVHSFIEGGMLPDALRVQIFGFLNEGLLGTLRELYLVFVNDIATVIHAVRNISVEELTSLVHRLRPVLSFTSTPDSLQSFFMAHPVSSNGYVGSHAVLHGLAGLVTSPEWQPRFYRSNVTSFNALLQSFMDVGRSVMSVQDAHPIAIMTGHQFVAIVPANPPRSGTKFLCTVRGEDAAAFLPGQQDAIIGICSSSLHWNRYLVRVLRDPNYTIHGYWGEDFSVFQHNQPAQGIRFMATLVCYVSENADNEQRSFADFRERFGVGDTRNIMPWGL